jgi:hypothetical protein
MDKKQEIINEYLLGKTGYHVLEKSMVYVVRPLIGG